MFIALKKLKKYKNGDFCNYYPKLKVNKSFPDKLKELFITKLN